MVRKFLFLVWILSAAAIGFLAFMPDTWGRGVYAAIFSEAFYRANLDAIQFGAHFVFIWFNTLFLFLLLNTSRNLSETGKFIIAFVWITLLTLVSEVGQMYLLPDSYNRTGLNLRDALANYCGLIIAWLCYFIFAKLVYGFLKTRHGN